MAAMQSNDDFIKEALEKGSFNVIKPDAQKAICRCAVSIGNETRFMDVTDELVLEFRRAAK